MAKYLEILKENTRHNIPVHAIIAILLLCFSPLVLGVENLPYEDAAKVLERYVALLGIIMLTPVFLPEQNPDLRDLIRSKYTKITAIYGIRVLEAVILLALLLGAYMAVLSYNSCQLHVLPYYGGTLAVMLFVGGLGIFGFALFDNLIAGYMIPVFYYIVAFGSGAKYLKVFYPFSMAQGSYAEKFWLFAGGMILIAAGIFIRGRK